VFGNYGYKKNQSWSYLNHLVYIYIYIIYVNTSLDMERVQILRKTKGLLMEVGRYHIDGRDNAVDCAELK